MLVSNRDTLRSEVVDQSTQGGVSAVISFNPAPRAFSLSTIAVVMYRCNFDVASLRFYGILGHRRGT